jgi:hypothetical protein
MIRSLFKKAKEVKDSFSQKARSAYNIFKTKTEVEDYSERELVPVTIPSGTYRPASMNIGDLVAQSTLSAPQVEDAHYSNLLGTEVKEEPKKEIKYISSIEDYFDMDERSRKDFESKLFDRYFSQKTDRKNFFTKLSVATWKKDGNTYKIDRKVIESLFNPINSPEYGILSSNEKNDIKAFVRERYNDRISEEKTQMTREQRITDMSKNIVVPYARRSVFLSSELIDYLLK